MLGTKNAFGSYSVADLDQAKNFYENVLDIRTEMMPMGVLELHLPGGGRAMVYPKPDHQPATFTVMNFVVDDIEKAVDDLMDRGISFEKYDGFNQDERGIARDENGPGIAWFRDPAGNVLSVLEDA